MFSVTFLSADVGLLPDGEYVSCTTFLFVSGQFSTVSGCFC